MRTIEWTTQFKKDYKREGRARDKWLNCWRTTKR